MSAATPKAAIVIDAGDATGGTIARRFAREGLTAVVVRRTAAALEPLVATIEADREFARWQRVRRLR